MRNGLTVLGVLYAITALVLMLLQVTWYAPAFHATQLQQVELLNTMALDLAVAKRESVSAASNALDNGYQIAMLADTVSALLYLNQQELNATLALINIFSDSPNKP
jgi:hypothetical protein